MTKESNKGTPENLIPWKKGVSANPNGRPKGTAKPISGLRKTLNKIKELEEKAIENIEKAVRGEDIDKQQLETSKWVISTVSSLTSAATREEGLRHQIKKDNEEPARQETEEKANGTTGVPQRPRLQLTMPDVDSEED